MDKLDLIVLWSVYQGYWLFNEWSQERKVEFFVKYDPPSKKNEDSLFGI